MHRQELLALLFPQPTVRFANHDTEVQGLPRNTVPQNCEILDIRKGGDSLRRRDHFLVQVEDALVALRVCTADAQCGYEEYAVIREVAQTPQEQDALLDYTGKCIEARVLP